MNWIIPHFNQTTICEPTQGLQAATTGALCGERQGPEFSFLLLQMKNLVLTMWAISCVFICELFPNRPLDVSPKMTKTTNRKSKKNAV